MGHDCFPFDGGLAAQSVLFSAPVVVGAFEFLVTIAIRNCSRVAHACRFRTFFCKRLKKNLHRGVVPAGGDLAHKSHQSVPCQSLAELLGAEAAAPI